MEAQDGGAVWRRGGVDGRPDKVDALIPILKMGSRKMAAAASGACATAPVLSLLDRLLLPTHHWAAWLEAFGFRCYALVRGPSRRL